MDALLINGPARLKGKVRVSGSKNTALPLIFSALLFDGEVKFKNVPRLWDIETTLQILEAMGAETQWDKEEGMISLYPRLKNKVAPYELVRKMRAGILALGPLLAKYGEATVSLPGGCAIGARPVNYHLEAMRKMGVSVDVEEGYVKARLSGRLKGAQIVFPQVTVTGTENLLILATAAEGETRMENCAAEPEVVALGEMLIRRGAKIRGLGTPTIEVIGGPLGTSDEAIEIPPDRIEAGTWISAAVATRSEIEIESCEAEQMGSVLEVYRRMGVPFEVTAAGTTIRVGVASPLKPLAISTAPYPGFPTDMQAQVLTNLCLAEGASEVRETIFENRFMHVAELRRLGAKISVEGNLAKIQGPVRFEGAPMMATDLRASASLVVAGLAARGRTKVSRIYHLDRGYQRLDEKLRALGADVERVNE
jgi:UDP-N-acetylglucosamine 1-carboxyvinyltransferase